MLEIKEEIDIEIIKPLWEALNRYQTIHSKNFSDYYRTLNFKTIQEKMNHRNYRLEVIYQDEIPLGFILAYIDQYSGVIEALYLYDDLRGQGLGSYITERMILWLKMNNAEKIELNVSSGSEELIHFYKKFHFKIRSYTMELI